MYNGIHREHHDSSAITESLYQQGRNRLYILFKNGICYLYENIDWEMYRNFVTADSIGRYYNQVIRKREIGTLVDGFPVKEYDLSWADQIDDNRQTFVF